VVRLGADGRDAGSPERRPLPGNARGASPNQQNGPGAPSNQTVLLGLYDLADRLTFAVAQERATPSLILVAPTRYDLTRHALAPCKPHGREMR
jgi:hypothetical protein